MKNTLKKTWFVLALSVLAIAGVQGQTKADAIEAYNEGAQMISVDVNAAIEAFNRCLEICEQVGEEADDTKILVEGYMADLYYQSAMNLYRDKKIEASIPAFEKALEAAVQYNDTKTKQRVENVIPQLYFSIGTSLYKEKKMEEALVNFDKAIELNPNYTRAYFSKAVIYRGMDNTEKMLEAFDLTIEKGAAENDTETVTRSKKLARDYIMVRATRAKDAEKFADALDLINTSLKYQDDDSEAYYLQAVIYNRQSKWNDAVAAANKGIENVSGTDADKAKFFYEIGTAQMGRKDNAAACAAFRNATHGLFIEAAQYQITHVLKCP
jgi:tetratricopeptide (TPR) repeat protein